MEYDNGVSREEELLKFCGTPRTRVEIAGLLGIRAAKHYARINVNYLNPLTKQGKLKPLFPYDYPMERQQWTSDLETKNIQEQIIGYCAEPRSKLQIKERFGLTRKTFALIADGLIESGKLMPISTTAGVSKFQKYVKCKKHNSAI
jgi:hypothetical protein